MSDLLKQSALAYQALMPYRYHFTLGRKQHLYKMSIIFPEDAYHHLAGFHKSGFEALRIKKKSLANVLAGSVTHAQFSIAGCAMEDRWEGICGLQSMIESNKTVFRYRGHEYPGSKLKGDYLLTNETIAFFVVDNIPESIFAHQGRCYEQNCPRLVTLQIWREAANEEQILIYQSPSYRA